MAAKKKIEPIESQHYDWSLAKFSDKERLFVMFYVSNNRLNKTQAAIDAGYAKKTASGAAVAIYNRPHINKAIRWYLNKIETKALVTAERVLEELACIAFLDPRKFYNENGSLKNVVDLEEGVARAMAGFEVSNIEHGRGEDAYTETLSKVKHGDKIKALELIGKKFKMFTDKIEINNRPLVVVKDLSGRKLKTKSE